MSEPIGASLVRIRTKAGSVAGAGFLVGKRHVLTCAHVVAQALDLPKNAIDQPSSTVSLDFPQLASHTMFTAEVVYWYPEQGDGRGDIAGLKLLDKPPVGAEAIHFAPADQIWGHPYCAFGFPTGQDDGVWSEGRLLERQGTNWIQLVDDKIPGFAIIRGFSGAPVWDRQLQGVVGMIVTFIEQPGLKVAFAIPYDVLIEEWQELRDVVLPLVPRNPYKGLHAFTEHDTGDFFGRNSLIDELAAKVETALTRKQKEGQCARLLAVIGPSGSGKSSAVMAGLLPSLRDGEVFNSEEWVYLDLVFPGEHPLNALAASLAKQKELSARGAVSLKKDLILPDASSLHLLVCQLAASPQQRVVLIVDQFEEVFTLTTDEAERGHFFDLLTTAVEQSGPLFVILTLRADFYDRPMHYPKLYRLIDDHKVSVLPMERDDLRKVIEGPANLSDVKLTFERGLVDELLLEMQGQSGALPLLEFTLDQLVQRRNGRQLTLQAYREMGGVKEALSQHAEETFKALPSDEHRQMAQDIFLRLIEPGGTEQDTTRRRAAREEFERADSQQAQQMQQTLEAFIRERLLTTNQINDIAIIEVSHETLIQKWDRLATWLAEWLRDKRNDILIQQSLSKDAEEWKRQNRPRDRLYRGAQLKEAQEWARRDSPSKEEVAFLKASATQRTLSLVGLVVVVLLLISLAGVAGWFALTRPHDPTLVTTLQDSVSGSLRYCIDNAPSGSTIRFAQGMRGIIELTGGGLAFAGGKQLTIAGPGANQLAISGSNLDAIIHISKDAKLDISDLSFKNSETVNDAFLFNEGTLTLTNSIVSNNKTTAGGAIFVNSVSSGGNSLGGGIENRGILTVINSIISNNSSSGDPGDGLGGGIENEGQLAVIHSTFSRNSASSYDGGNSFGGSIDNYGRLTVTSSTFSNNSVSSTSGGKSEGGGIFNHSHGTLTVTSSTFSHNSASSSGNNGLSQGGGIENDGKLTAVTSTFSNNSVSSTSGGTSLGGGIFNSGYGTLMVTSSTFSDNSASGNKEGSGGGIENDGSLTVTVSTFVRNSASSNQDAFGGGIDNYGSSAIIRFCTIYSNMSEEGGGIWTDPTNRNQMNISSSIIAANSANSAQNGPDISGSLISGGYNLLTNVAGVTGLDARTDKRVTLSDLKLDPTLRNNGGPTQTLTLLPGSQAIDAVPRQACSITVTDVSGHTVTITTDQRDNPRPDGSENACDIGAYESSYQG